jgi:hypothetical protein
MENYCFHVVPAFPGLQSVGLEVGKDRLGSLPDVRRQTIHSVVPNGQNRPLLDIRACESQPEKQTLGNDGGSLSFGWVIDGNCPCYNAAYVRLIVCYVASTHRRHLRLIWIRAWRKL